MEGIRQYEAVSRNEPDIVHVYKRDGNRFPSPSDRQVSERPGHQRSILLINWKPSTTYTWRQIADGAADANIENVAEGIKAYPYKFFLTVWHEPENDLGGPGSGQTTADYVAMYRYVVNKLRSLGVTNVVYVWNMMGSSNHSHLYDELYPGHDVVDWIAWDPYGQEKVTDMGLLVNRPVPARNWPGFYQWATAKAPGKPLMLAEWGFDHVTSTHGPAALRSGAEILSTQYPQLKALVYWNQNRIFQVRLDEPTPYGRDYGEAYAEFANHPYFNSTSTAAAP